MKKFSLKADYAIKELFAHEKVRRQFLSDVLGIPIEEIKSVRIANPFLRKFFKKQKQGILDIVLVLNDDTKIDIEMQVQQQKHWNKRNLYYLARMYTDDLMIGDNYGKLHRCISISLLDFSLLPDSEKYHSIYRLRDENGRELTDLWEVHIIELGKELKGSAVDDWIRFFNAQSQEEVDMITVKNEGMREAVEVVREMGLLRTMRWIYDDYWKAKRDRWAEDEYVKEEGIAIGKARGMELGMAEGMELGMAEGMELGKAEGMELGKAEGMELGKAEGMELGKAEGMELGKAEGKAECILQLLKSIDDQGELSRELEEKIESEHDITLLERWFLLAAKAETLGQFREKAEL